MFEIKEQYCVTQTEKLLYNIWQTLQGQKEPVTAEQVQPQKEYICQVCGEKFGTNRHKYAAHAQKHKKEGG